MDWYYDKKKIVSIATAIVIVICGIVVGGYALDSNAQTDLDIAMESITSEMATDSELEAVIGNLPTQEDIADLSSLVAGLRLDVEEFIEAQEELDLEQWEFIDDILNQLDAIEDDLSDIEDNLYGEDGVWEAIEEMQDDIHDLKWRWY